MLKKLIKLVKALNGYVNPNQIAFAVSCGIILGFLPKDNGIWYILFLIFCFIRINKPAFFLVTLLCSLLTPSLDPFFHSIGTTVLEYQPLVPLYQTMLSVPLVPLTRFNNTIVMGSFLCGLILYIPAFFLFRTLIILYRKNIRDKIKQSKCMKAFYRLPLVKKIADLSDIKSEVAPWQNN